MKPINEKLNHQKPYQSSPYQSTLSRRESLKWLGVLSASALVTSITGCSDILNTHSDVARTVKGHWPDLKLPPISAQGYGKDPKLINPISPWPKTLTAEQLTLVAVLGDILVPRDGDVPSASQVNVPDVIDEWVSAPYEKQQRDRLTILSALTWIDDESRLRFSNAFVALSTKQQFEIMDDIAYQNTDVPEQFQQISNAFSSFRKLVVAAFFCSPEGTKDLGYIGNIPIMGAYPGPTAEAKIHLEKIIADLGLSKWA